MAHIIRPIGTFAADAGWAPTGAPTLWEAVDEAVPDDGDFARVTGNNQSWVLQFGPGTDHAIHTGHVLRWRMRRLSIAIRMSIDIYQNNAWLFHVGVVAFLGPPNNFYDHFVNLPQADCALITNYAGLGLRMVSNNFNPPNRGDVSWVELELPGDYWTTPIVQTDPATEIT